MSHHNFLYSQMTCKSLNINAQFNLHKDTLKRQSHWKRTIFCPGNSYQRHIIRLNHSLSSHIVVPNRWSKKGKRPLSAPINCYKHLVLWKWDQANSIWAAYHGPLTGAWSHIGITSFGSVSNSIIRWFHRIFLVGQLSVSVKCFYQKLEWNIAEYCKGHVD